MPTGSQATPPSNPSDWLTESSDEPYQPSSEHTSDIIFSDTATPLISLRIPEPTPNISQQTTNDSDEKLSQQTCNTQMSSNQCSILLSTSASTATSVSETSNASNVPSVISPTSPLPAALNSTSVINYKFDSDVSEREIINLFNNDAGYYESADEPERKLVVDPDVAKDYDEMVTVERTCRRFFARLEQQRLGYFLLFKIFLFSAKQKNTKTNVSIFIYIYMFLYCTQNVHEMKK